MPRLLAIGDVHGHSKALEHLIRFARIGPEDTLIMLGDYINRGPDSRGVIERLLKFTEENNLIPLLGNHEITMLQARQSKSDVEFFLDCGGRETLASYGTTSLDDIPEAHWNFFSSCSRFHEEQKVFFVHANVDPSLPLEHQPDHELFWRHLEFAPWHVSGKVMICGHTPQPGGLPVHFGTAICIDSDVNRTGWLTCLEPKTGRYWQAHDSGQTRMGLLEPPDDFLD
ncbi:MAG: serine/threonine protein phosphatase [Verrucomicrobiaceae bacterium]|nr:serine/threonine protein phosphatase [Verrucomicrobiaceae bacterium]